MESENLENQKETSELSLSWIDSEWAQVFIQNAPGLWEYDGNKAPDLDDINFFDKKRGIQSVVELLWRCGNSDTGLWKDVVYFSIHKLTPALDLSLDKVNAVVASGYVTLDWQYSFLII